MVSSSWVCLIPVLAGLVDRWSIQLVGMGVIQTPESRVSRYVCMWVELSKDNCPVQNLCPYVRLYVQVYVIYCRGTYVCIMEVPSNRFLVVTILVL